MVVDLEFNLATVAYKLKALQATLTDAEKKPVKPEKLDIDDDPKEMLDLAWSTKTIFANNIFRSTIHSTCSEMRK